MSKIFKNMLPYWKSVIIIVALLFVQAWCDLSLPAYTSKIIDVGIQSSGVEHVVPEKLTEEEFETAEFIMTEEEEKLWESSYRKDGELYSLIVTEKDELEMLDEKLAVPLIMNYQMSNMDESAVKQLVAAQSGTDEKALEKLSIEEIGAMLGVNLKSFQQEKEDENGNSVIVNCTDIRPVFENMLSKGMLEKDTILSMRDSMEETIDTMGTSLVKSMGVAYAVSCDKAAGLDVEKIQKSYLLTAGAKMVGMALIIGIVTVFVGFFASRVGAGIGKSLREKVFKKVVSFSNAEMDQFSTASLITRSTNDIQQIQMVSVMLLRMIAYAPILGAGGVIKVIQTGAGMGWIILLAVAVILGYVMVLMSIAMPKFKLMQKLIDNMNLVSREILTGLSVIRAFGREKKEEEHFDLANRDLTKTMLFTNRVMTFMMPGMMMIMNLLSVGIVWFGAHKIDRGSMQVGAMTAFITYAMMIVMSFLMLTMLSIMLPRAAVSMQRIGKVLDVEPRIEDPAEPKTLQQPKGEICFDHVSFAYPDADEKTLDDISFTAKPGQTTAIIGSTGSGKSTMLNLIPRFYDATEGAVRIDGVDIRDITQENLREQIGYVPQKGVLFSGSIASNLQYGKEDASYDEMVEAAETAQAMEFIQTKENGLDEEVSQGGTNVSGGQKQRLSIARALVKKARVYLFDDSFSALDFKTDQVLRKALKEKVGDSTIIIVAQRINTVLDADQIIVMDEGHMAGIGTHEELMRSCEVYKEIALSQLSEEELERGRN